jgi:polyisoprenoid-binding protein YceI
MHGSGALPMARRPVIGLGPAMVLATGFVSFQTLPAAAQQPNVDFNVSGTSTIRGWTCSARGVIAVTPAKGGAAAVPGFASGVQTATVTVPVKAFKCPNDEMTQHLLEAMKADKFPEIVYRLEKYDIAGAQAQATGTMTITGTSQPIAFPIALKAAGQGVQVEGNTRLDMTKYGVEPPVVMLGMLKVGPQIRIEFKGLVTP